MQIKLSMINWLNCIWESDLPSNSKYLAAYLRKFMNDNQDMAWPSYSRISKETGLARPTISKYLAILDEKGWLKREKGNSEKNTVYYAVFPTELEQQLALVNGEGSKGDLLGVVKEVNSNKQENKPITKQKDIVEKGFNFIWEETKALKKQFPIGRMGSKKDAKIKFDKLFNDKYFKDHSVEDFKKEVNGIFEITRIDFELSLKNLENGSDYRPFENRRILTVLNAEEWRN